jgi:multidrug efflux system membrane fusion protein
MALGSEDWQRARKGYLDFLDNQVDPGTGSIPVRGVFDNPLLPSGERLLKPGMFIRVQIPIGAEKPALLVIDRAIGSDQGIKFVYVLGAGKKFEKKTVTTGALQADGLRVVDGLQGDEWVAVGGIPQINPRIHYPTEELTAMPTNETGSAGLAAPAPQKQAPAGK